MSRPPRERILDGELSRRTFQPADAADEGAREVVLSLDEAEALRLGDWEGLYHEAAAARMGVSRTTFGRIIASAHRKTADALLHGKTIRIEGGAVTVGRAADRPLRVAVPATDSGEVEEHFGRCRRIQVFTLDEAHRVIGSETLATEVAPGCKPAELASLAARGVSALVVGCIGERAVRIGASHGIRVLRGATGPADAAAVAFARGELVDVERKCGRPCMAFPTGCP
jgi:uncharacterized protein